MPDQQSQADLITSLMRKIAGKEGEKASSFPATLIIVGILVLVISVMGIKLAFAKRKAVELAIKIRRAEEEKKQVEECAKFEENASERQTAKKAIEVRAKKILGLKAQMARRLNRHKEAVAKLKSITSWDDIIVVEDPQ